MFSSIKQDIRNQWSKPNSGLQQIIIINVFIFIVLNILMMIMTKEGFAEFLKYVAMPTDLPTLLVRPWTVVTSFFTHYSFSHIFWNMLYFYWFGMLVREYLGNDRLISLFVLGGLIGSMSVILLFNFIPSFVEHSGGIALGASAGVFAVTVGAATLLPDYRFHLLLLGPVKIKYIAMFLIFFSITGLKGTNVGGEVAHLAGAAIGYFYIRSLNQGNDLGAWVTSFLAFIKSFFVRQPKMKVNYSSRKTTGYAPRSEKKPTASKAPSQAEIDAILDKISQSGYESLSKDEKEKLFNASRR
ncbi:MAG: rhomboid family intramembrane serine protease [Cyclobacteriaceae bacterium]|nr:rhomboid family intramembrane serine protease [Cyclobacteriaceae bacterium]